jgi:hypothetical protein
LDHLFQTDVKATRIEFRELWRGEADCAVEARAFKSLRDKASTTAADAVFDAVVLPLYGAIERRLTRRLGNAGPRRSTSDNLDREDAQVSVCWAQGPRTRRRFGIGHTARCRRDKDGDDKR